MPPDWSVCLCHYQLINWIISSYKLQTRSSFRSVSLFNLINKLNYYLQPQLAHVKTLQRYFVFITHIVVTKSIWESISLEYWLLHCCTVFHFSWLTGEVLCNVIWKRSWVQHNYHDDMDKLQTWETSPPSASLDLTVSQPVLLWGKY